MSSPTLVRTIRDNTIGSFYTVPAYSDLAGNGTSFVPGDVIEVLSSGLSYICTGPEDFIPAQPERLSINGLSTNFQDGVGKAVADTGAASTLVGSGLRIYGQGVEQTDAGLTVAFGAGGPVASVIATNEAAHLTAIGLGGTTEAWAPATHGPMVVEARVAMSSALTDRAFFLGFYGTDADALDPVVTGSTTTLTLVQDNLAGLFYDSGLTDADRLFAPWNNADGAATIATTAAGVDTGIDFPAAGTYIDLKVRIEADGTMHAYANGARITTIPAAVATATALNPVCYVGSNTTATSTMLVKHFAAYSLA